MFNPEVTKELRHYVYLYIDPSTDEIFYVGKGSGNRAFSHLGDDAECEKVERLRRIRRLNLEPTIEVLAHGLRPRAALQLEAAVIDLLGKEQLTNAVRGWRSGIYGRMTVDQLRAQYSAAEVEIESPAILIRINNLFRYGMTPVELYDATRGVWVVGPNRHKAELAMAVFDGVVQEVYQVRAWFPGGSTLSSRGEETSVAHRWEFVGNVAPPEVRNRYRFKAVRQYFPKYAQNPIRYVNLESDEADSETGSPS